MTEYEITHGLSQDAPGPLEPVEPIAAPTSHPIPTGAAGEDSWRIDNSAGRPILVRNNCSVIEAEDAEYVLRLIAADRARAPTFATSIFGERIGKMMDCSAAPAAGDALLPNLDLDAAAKTMAECMDYLWAHMPEQGREQMRKNAKSVIDAAIAQQQGGAA